MNSREQVERIAGPTQMYEIKSMDKMEQVVHFFGDNVAFDKDEWMKSGGSAT